MSTEEDRTEAVEDPEIDGRNPQRLFGCSGQTLGQNYKQERVLPYKKEMLEVRGLQVATRTTRIALDLSLIYVPNPLATAKAARMAVFRVNLEPHRAVRPD